MVDRFLGADYDILAHHLQLCGGPDSWRHLVYWEFQSCRSLQGEGGMNAPGRSKDPHAYWNELPNTLTPEGYIDLMMSAMCLEDPVYAAYRHYLEERFISERLAIRDSDHVLDLGCGFGRLSFVFSRLASRVEGVDFSRRYVEIANELKAKNGISNVNFTCSSAVEFSANPSGYDLVYMGGLLVCMDNDDEILSLIRKIRECMRPNGRCVIREPSPIDNLRISRQNLTFRTIDELVGIFEAAELELNEIREAVPVGPIFYRIAASVLPSLRRREKILSAKALRIFRAQEYFSWLVKPITLCATSVRGRKSDFRFYFHIYAPG